MMRRRCPVDAPAGWGLETAPSVVARTRGLLGRSGLGGRAGLWLPVRSVHTWGMRFALDLVWLDAAGGVVRIDDGVVPRRVRSCAAARGGVVEVAAGSGAALAVALDPSARPASGRVGRPPADADQSSAPGASSASSGRLRVPR